MLNKYKQLLVRTAVVAVAPTAVAVRRVTLITVACL